MRHPLWIINSALAVMLLGIALFITISRVDIPPAQDIEPSGYIKPAAKKVSEVNIRKIYEQDLFDTYIPALEEIKAPDFVAPMPPPPQPKPVRVPPEPKPQFLKPLDIGLKGIMIVGNDDTKNRAVISDNKTKREIPYKVGDIIEDAQLIKIFSNKVLFLRSNGQQEVLYLRPKDAQLDPTYALLGDWNDVILKKDPYNYLVNVNEFTFRIKNLAQFIDQLDLVTVYKQGASVGCKVGKIAEHSLGSELGLQTGDVITAINGIPVTDTAHRMQAYKKVIAMKTKETIIVELLRNGKPLALMYTLEDTRKPKSKVEKGVSPTQEVSHEQLKQLHERHKFAPTMKEIRSRDRTLMMEKGKTPERRPKAKLTE